MSELISFWRSDARDERGASAIIVGISVIMLIGFAAFAVDAGNAWQNRRHVIVASDAAALAAAQEYALGGNGCGGTDDEFVTANDPNASVVSCTPGNITSTSGFVTVTAATPMEFVFAGVLGIADSDVSATTTASYQVAQSVVGLRPFGLCTTIAALMRGSGSIERIYYNKDTQATAADPLLVCPENPEGNWAMIDLDNETPISNAQFQDWVENGYPEAVAPGTIGGDTGAFANSISDELDAIMSSSGDEKVFCLPVYAGADGQGAGASFDVTGFAAVTLWGYNTTGEPEARYLDLRIEDVGICEPGSLSGGPAVDFGVRTVRICDVDYADNLSEC